VSEIRNRLEKLSWPVLLLVVMAALAMAFATGAFSWWLAHHMAWWTYALLSPAWIFGSSLAKQARKEVRKSRLRRRQRDRVLDTLADHLLERRQP
jgi:protein-S-isoprenylcysteine O-methyltransferase Ste14